MGQRSQCRCWLGAGPSRSVGTDCFVFEVVAPQAASTRASLPIRLYLQAEARELTRGVDAKALISSLSLFNRKSVKLFGETRAPGVVPHSGGREVEF